MAGLRVGYALGSADDAELLSLLTPGQGVASPAQAAVAAGLENPERSSRAARGAGGDGGDPALGAWPRPCATRRSPSQSRRVHLVWLRGEGMTAAQITHGLAGQRIHVTSGAAWDDEEHVRITLRDERATQRLVAALAAL